MNVRRAGALTQARLIGPLIRPPEPIIEFSSYPQFDANSPPASSRFFRWMCFADVTLIGAPEEIRTAIAPASGLLSRPLIEHGARPSKTDYPLLHEKADNLSGAGYIS